jgi:acyl-CoA thioesterase|tara:strand:- start:3882 stop:4292 length:411 start_codon:yes stop_codon:yes gene_type:complete
MLKPKEIIERMMENDSYSKWLGIELVDIKKGYCKLKMHVTQEMTNGFFIAHGGICYSLADSALAFASNSNGNKALSVETSISHTKKVNKDDTLTAETQELSITNKTGLYSIIISNQNNIEVALFKGTVYISDKTWH